MQSVPYPLHSGIYLESTPSVLGVGMGWSGSRVNRLLGEMKERNGKGLNFFLLILFYSAVGTKFVLEEPSKGLGSHSLSSGWPRWKRLTVLSTEEVETMVRPWADL